jgi:exopolysaccharide/PEP-CTERM locus tyrosine autokinase
MSIIDKAFEKFHHQRRESASQKQLGADGATKAATTQSAAFESPYPPVVFDTEQMILQGLLPAESKARRVRDEFRRIKWPLLEVALKRVPSTLPRASVMMMTSSIPSEGKTFSSINLALSMVREQDCTVLLIDADIAKPKISRLLGLGSAIGLTNYLANPAMSFNDIVHPTTVPNLYLVPAGHAHPNGPELLASPRMEQLVDYLAALPTGFVTLFDSPPLLATNEAQVLSRLAGQVILVVRADSTPRHAVQEAISLVSKTAALGIIINQQRSTFGSRYYGEYYDYEYERD